MTIAHPLLTEHYDALWQQPVTAAFFEEPFDLTYIATVLLDDDFFMGAYLVCGQPKRWYACADQLPKLFIEFVEAGIPESKLYQLAALMWRWTWRLPEPQPPKARRYLAEQLAPFSLDRLDTFVRRQFEEGEGWRTPPWKVR